MKDVLIEGLREHRVDLLSKVDLCHLQPGKAVGQDGILEVGLHHRLEHLHIFWGELAHTLVQHATDISISRDLAIDNLLDVILTLSE